MLWHAEYEANNGKVANGDDDIASGIFSFEDNDDFEDDTTVTQASRESELDEALLKNAEVRHRFTFIRNNDNSDNGNNLRDDREEAFLLQRTFGASACYMTSCWPWTARTDDLYA